MTDDDELFRRFNALRAPSHPPAIPPEISDPKQHVEDKARLAEQENDEIEAIADGRKLPDVSVLGPPSSNAADADEDAFASRIRALKGQTGDGGELDDEETSDKDVEAFLASLTAGGSPSGPDDSEVKTPTSKDEHDLASEAENALQAAAPHMPDPDSTDSTVEPETIDDEETEDEIIARALADASLDHTREPSADKAPAKDPASPREETESTESSFNFPSLPSHVPKEDEEPRKDFDDDTKKRMDMLLGLSGPVTKPGGPTLPQVPKRAPGQGWNIPGYEDTRDEDIDSWCCICNQDAELVCLGCDDDLYCLACWKEGHEMEKHRVRRFVWTRKKALGA